MKKNLLPIILSISGIFCSCTINAQNSSTISNSTRELKIDKKFEGLKSQSAIEIIYTQNNKPSIANIQGPKEIIDGMSWQVDGQGNLSFKLPNFIKKQVGKVTIQLNGGLLTNYEASSAGSIKILSPVKTDKFLQIVTSSAGKIFFNDDVTTKTSINIVTSSSGKIEFQKALQGYQMSMVASSSGMISIPSLSLQELNYTGSSVGLMEVGQANLKRARVTVSSGGGSNFNKLVTDEIKVISSSGGEFECKDISMQQMTLTASSGGTITMSGKCGEASMSASSGGKINVKGMTIDKINSQSSSSSGQINL